jgi:hypothetical protein
MNSNHIENENENGNVNANVEKILDVKMNESDMTVVEVLANSAMTTTATTGSNTAPVSSPPPPPPPPPPLPPSSSSTTSPTSALKTESLKKSRYCRGCGKRVSSTFWKRAPANITKREKWEKILGMPLTPNNMFCELHFLSPSAPQPSSPFTSSSFSFSFSSSSSTSSSSSLSSSSSSSSNEQLPIAYNLPKTLPNPTVSLTSKGKSYILDTDQLQRAQEIIFEQHQKGLEKIRELERKIALLENGREEDEEEPDPEHSSTFPSTSSFSSSSSSTYRSPTRKRQRRQKKGDDSSSSSFLTAALDAGAFPEWYHHELSLLPHHFSTNETRMAAVLRFARLNFETGSGGPFAAGIFEKESGLLVSMGINR